MRLNAIAILLLAMALMLLTGCSISSKQFTPSELYERFAPAVPVVITEDGIGSGIVIDQGNYVITAAHVVEGEDRVIVTIPGGYYSQAIVVNYDRSADLALLKPVLPIELKHYPELAMSDPVPGDEAIVMGFPYGYTLGTGTVTLTRGVISAIRKHEGHSLLQFDAAVNSGNSGGPLLSLDGKLLGIVSSKLMEEAGIGFAISSATYLSLEKTLREPRTAAQSIRAGDAFVAEFEAERRRLRLSARDALLRKAIWEYSQAITISPYDATSYVKRGLTYGAFPGVTPPKGKLAISDFTEAIRIYPDYLDAYLERARMYDLLLGDPQWYRKEDYPHYPNLISADYASAIRIDPENLEAHLGMAENHYEIAVYFSPYRNLSSGEKHTVTSNFDQAIDYWTIVTQIDPSNKEAYGGLAMVHDLYGRSHLCEENLAKYESLSGYEHGRLYNFYCS